MTDVLNKILNTMMIIKTEGESTILMGECLKAMKDVIRAMTAETATKNVIQETDE